MTCNRCGATLRAGNTGPLCSPCLRSVFPEDVELNDVMRWIKHPPSWLAQAACRGEMPTMFTEPFSRNRSTPLDSHGVRKAKHLCATCPVRRDCLADELERQQRQGIKPGIRGGTLPNERIFGDLDDLLDKMKQQAQANGLMREGAVA